MNGVAKRIAATFIPVSIGAMFLFLTLFIVQPSTRYAQFVLDLFLLLLFLRPTNRRSTLKTRILLSWTVLAIGLRYFFWRVTTTIHGSQWDVLASSLLISAESYTFLSVIIGFFQTITSLPRRPVLLPTSPEDLPTVDVFIPTYNEPATVVRPTLIGALNLDYPPDRLRIYLLDDGRREEFRELARNLGINYLIREDNRHAKAGNLNNALKYTSGDLVVILDSDHIPSPDFLRETVGGFLRDPSLAMLQTPHNFYNDDPFERNLRIHKEVPNESELFYHVIQPGNDLWNAAFFCGSAGILRRSALEQIGGFQTETVTEDAHTSIILHSRGWNSAYIRKPLTSGLSVETLGHLINQRIRWCRGMVQIFRLSNPLFIRGLSFFQRLIYLNTIMYWFFGLPRLVFLTAPLWFLYLGIYSLHASIVDILLYLGPYLLLAIKTNRAAYGHYRHSFWSEIYEAAISYYLITPALTALFRPRSGSFGVTPKGSRIDREFFDIRLASPSLMLLVLNLGGLLIGGVKIYHGSADRGILAMNMFWALYNIAITTLAVATAIEGRQVRKHNRITLKKEGEISDPRHPEMPPLIGQVEDISLGGFRLIIVGTLKGVEEEVVSRPVLFRVVGSVTPLPAQIVNVAHFPDKTTISASFGEMGLKEERALIECIFGNPTHVLHQSARSPDRILHTLAIILTKSIRMMGLILHHIGLLRKIFNHFRPTDYPEETEKGAQGAGRE